MGVTAAETDRIENEMNCRYIKRSPSSPLIPRTADKSGLPPARSHTGLIGRDTVCDCAKSLGGICDVEHLGNSGDAPRAQGQLPAAFVGRFPVAMATHVTARDEIPGVSFEE